MSRRHSPRPAVCLGALLLLLALLLLWFSFGCPATAETAARRVEQEHLAGVGTTVASGRSSNQFYSITSGKEVTERRLWLVRQNGSHYALVTLKQTLGGLWCPDDTQPYVPFDAPEDGPISLRLAGLDSVELSEYGLAFRVTPLIVCRDPSVTRIEVLLFFTTEGDRASGAEHGVTVSLTKTSPGSAVWTGPETLVEPYTDGDGHSLTAWYQAYNSSGDLVCSYAPRHDPPSTA